MEDFSARFNFMEIIFFLCSRDNLKSTGQSKKLLIQHIFTTLNNEAEMKCCVFVPFFVPFLRLLAIFGTKSS